MPSTVCYCRAVRGPALRRRFLVALVVAGLCQPVLARVADDAAFRFAFGRLLAEEGSTGDARRELERAVELDPEDPYLRLELANLLASVGAWEGATREVGRARELAPENPDVLRTFGQIHLYQVREDPTALQEAQAALERLREIAPEDLDSLNSLGRIYLSEQRFDDAADVFRQILGVWPGHPVARSSLIDALLRGGRTDEAEAALRDFLRHDPEAPRLRRVLAELLSEKGDHEGAARVLREGSEELLSEPEISRRLALELYQAGDSEAALRYLEPWIAQEPGDHRARLLRALLLSGLGRYDEAEAELSKLHEEHPDDVEVASLLARHHLRASRWQKALDVTEPFLENSVADDAAELALISAQALRELGRDAEALDRLALIASDGELGPRSTALQAEILLDTDRAGQAESLLADLASSDQADELSLAAGVYQRTGHYDEAIPILVRLVGMDPESVEHRFWLASAYERTGSFEEAEDGFEAILDADPEFAPALNYLGYMWAERGVRLDEALSLVEKAVSLEPDNGAYMDSLGWAHFQLGDYEQALQHLERAVDLEGDDATIFEHLGDTYRALGRLDEARDRYRRGLELAGDNAAALERKLDELE